MRDDQRRTAGMLARAVDAHARAIARMCNVSPQKFTTAVPQLMRRFAQDDTRDEGRRELALARMRWPSGIRWLFDAGALHSLDGSGIPGPRLSCGRPRL